MPRLSPEEFSQTFGATMLRRPPETSPAFDFWPYVDAIPEEDYEGYDCSAGRVEYVYCHPAGHIEQVLIDSDERDVFMAIVIDTEARTVFGHHLLDLPRLYGINDVPE